MVRVRQILFIFINIFPFAIGLIAVVVSIYFHIHGGSYCEKALRNPLLIIGLVLFVLSTLAFIGSLWNSAHFLLTIYSIFMVLIMLALTCFTIFTVVITNKAVSRKITGLGFGEYRLDDYSGWLQHYLLKYENWESIRSCLSEHSSVCHSIKSPPNFSDFIKQPLSPVQSGCCKPPVYCKYEYKNATFWEVPKSGPDVEDSDCRTWSNNQKELCYNCKSCKEGFLFIIRKKWRLLAILNISMLLLVLIAFNIGLTIRKRRRQPYIIPNHQKYSTAT